MPCLLDQVDPDRLLAILTDLPPSRSPRGGEENQRALVRTEEWLVTQLRSIGLEPEVLAIDGPGPEYEGAPEAWHNIVVDIPGITPPSATRPDVDALDGPGPTDGGPTATTNPLATRVLILSAHFDCVQGSPGADDDGSGVAALLEIARILHDARATHPLDHTVRLCFFNLEETGLLGSRDYCADILRPRLSTDAEDIIGMVSLEMLGYFTDAPNSQGSPIRILPDGTPAPTVGDFIALVGIASHQEFSGAFADAMTAGEPDMPVHRADYFPIPIPDILRSDHAPFLLLGVPAVMLTDTANFRNPNYHRASDSIATIDFPRFTKVVRAVLAATLELTNTPDQGLGGSTWRQRIDRRDQVATAQAPPLASPDANRCLNGRELRACAKRGLSKQPHLPLIPAPRRSSERFAAEFGKLPVETETPAVNLVHLGDLLGDRAGAAHARVQIGVVKIAAPDLADQALDVGRPIGHMALQPLKEQLLDLVRQAHHHPAGPLRPGLRGRLENRRDLAVVQPWDDRGGHHADGDARLRQRPHRLQPFAGRTGARLELR